MGHSVLKSFTRNMTIMDMETGSSWADQMENGDGELPPPHIEYSDDGCVKTVIEYKVNDENKKVRVTKTYKIEVKKVNISIARRKKLKKFGESAADLPGPNSHTTILAEEVHIQFVHNKENQKDDTERDPLEKLKQQQKLVTCRYCKGDHWSKQCPYKDKLEEIESISKDRKPVDESAPPASLQSKGGAKYVPPSMREGANKRGESMGSNRRDEAATIRVTNLSEDTRETDLQELFHPFGPIQRIFLAKDKVTGQSKGFAFINFIYKKDAQSAIEAISGYGYDHLILNVEWAKPSTNQ